MRAASVIQSQSKWICLSASVIAIATLIAYWPALNGGFIFDDDILVANNPIIQSSDGLYRIWFTTQPIDYWPVTNTAFWLEWHLWGGNTTGYHLVNLVLHICNALLIWLILRKLVIPGAFLAALLFAVHPINVESVAWISELKNTLSLFFFLVSIFYFMKDIEAASSPAAATVGSQTKRMLWISLGAFVLAMLSKGSVAILPVVLLLIVWWKNSRITRQNIQRSLPFFYAAAALTIVNIWFRTHGSAEVIRSVTWPQRLLGAGEAVWFYLAKTLLPIHQAFIYPQWKLDTSDPIQWLPLLAAIAVTFILWRLRNQQPTRNLLFAWLCFCVALLPVLGLVDTYYMKYSLVADQYQYIAMIPVLALIAAACCHGWEALRGIAQTALQSAVALVVILLIFVSTRQSALYANATTMYSATLLINPDCWVLHYNLANALDSANDHQQAIEHYRQTISLMPDYAQAHNNLGNTLANLGRTQEAIDEFQETLRLKPDWIADVHCALGITLSSAGRTQNAFEHFQQAIALKPTVAEYHFDYGNALLKAGRTQQASEEYQQAASLKPNFADAQSKLADVLARQNQLPEAIQHYQQALKLQPNSSAEVHAAFAVLLMKAGRQQEALDQYQQALHLQPENPDINYNLANALLRIGLLQESIQHYQHALRIKPEFVEAQNGLGAAYLMASQPKQAAESFQQALRINPNSIQAAANLAKAYSLTNHPEEAQAAANKAIDLAHSQGQSAIAEQTQAWLKNYQASLSNQNHTPNSLPPNHQ